MTPRILLASAVLVAGAFATATPASATCHRDFCSAFIDGPVCAFHPICDTVHEILEGGVG